MAEPRMKSRPKEIKLPTKPVKPTKIVREVIVTDIQMPFGSMVNFMVKWAFATIPAIICIYIIAAVLIAMFGGVLKGLL